MSVSDENVCDLSIIKAVYRNIDAGEGSPGWVYQIDVTQDGANNTQFCVPQRIADKFADELSALASLIRAHSRHRRAD
jgi:hypothetical protein